MLWMPSYPGQDLAWPHIPDPQLRGYRPLSKEDQEPTWQRPLVAQPLTAEDMKELTNQRWKAQVK